MKAIAMTLALLLLPTLAGCANAQTKSNNHKDEHGMATIHLTTQEFKQLVYNYEENPKEFKYNGTLPAIVDFYATWCGPCKALGPVLEDLAEEYNGKAVIYKVDVDQNEELAQLFGIRSVPTLLFIPADGSTPSMAPGAPGRAQLKAVIEQMIQK